MCCPIRVYVAMCMCFDIFACTREWGRLGSLKKKKLYRFFFLNKVFLTYLYCHHNGASTSYVIELLGLYMLFMKISEVTPLSSASGLASKDTTNHHDLSFCVLGLQGGAQEHRNSRKGGGTSRACRSYGVILKLFMITSTMKQGVGLF